MARSNGHHIAVLMLALGSAACFPHRQEFYRPEAAGGRIQRANCPPQPTFLLFERGRVVVGARAGATRDELDVTMTFEVPAGWSVRLSSERVEIHGTDQAVQTVDLAGHVMDSHGVRRIERGEVLRGEAVPPFSFRHWRSPNQPHANFSPYDAPRHRIYLYGATIAALRPGTVVVRFPRFLVNGRRASVPDVTFRRVKRWGWLLVMNC